MTPGRIPLSSCTTTLLCSPPSLHFNFLLTLPLLPHQWPANLPPNRPLNPPPLHPQPRNTRSTKPAIPGPPTSVSCRPRPSSGSSAATGGVPNRPTRARGGSEALSWCRGGRLLVSWGGLFFVFGCRRESGERKGRGMGGKGGLR